MQETMQKVTRFTEAQMGAIIDAINDGGEIAGVIKVWDILLGEPLETYEGPALKPWEYAIPRVQSHTIGEAIIARERSNPTHTGMAGGTWMNNGPTSFTESDGS